MKRMKWAAAAPLALMFAVGVPLASQASPVEESIVRAEQAATCDVADVTIGWGTLERWRSYVSGSIAQGSWDLDGDVAYEMPNFVWSNGSGTVALDGSTAELNATGSITFSGHNDLLRVTIANPTLDVLDETRAVLKLDLEATDMSGAEDVSAEQVEAVTLTLEDGFRVDDRSFTLTASDGVLTEGGVTAFGGFYDVGEPVDPITVSGTIAPDCGDGQAEATGEPRPEATDTPEVTTMAPEPVDADSGAPVLPMVIGAVVLLVIIGAVAYLLSSRKKGSGETEAQVKRS